MYHNFLIHLSADGRLGCVHVLGIVNSAAVNIGVRVSFNSCFLMCMPSSGIAGLYGSSISSFYWGIISHWSEWSPSKSLQTINAGEVVEKREPFYSLGGNANWYSHYGEHWGDSSHRFLTKIFIKIIVDSQQLQIVQRDSVHPLPSFSQWQAFSKTIVQCQPGYWISCDF